MSAAICVFLASSALAQGDPDVRTAARAFEEGQRAQLQNDYARAASLFEIAHRAAPAAPAIRSAISNHRAAGALARAATLSVVAAVEFPDAETLALTSEVLAEAEATLGRVDVRCTSPCALSVDGQLASMSEVDALRIFVTPGRHVVVARFGEAEVPSDVDAAAQSLTTLELDAPPEPEPVVEPEPLPIEEPIEEPGPSAPPTETERSGLSPLITYVGLGETAVLGAVLIWSLVDTANASDDYHANPTRAGYEDGRNRVRRTALLGAATGVAGIATLLIAVLATDWSGGHEDHAARLVPSAWVGSNGGGISLSGAL